MKQIKKALLACIEQINQAEIDFVSTLSFQELQKSVERGYGVLSGSIYIIVEDDEVGFTLKIMLAHDFKPYALLTSYVFNVLRSKYNITHSNNVDSEDYDYEKDWFTFLFGQDLTDLDVPLSSKDITSCFNEVRKLYEVYR